MLQAGQRRRVRLAATLPWLAACAIRACGSRVDAPTFSLCLGRFVQERDRHLAQGGKGVGKGSVGRSSRPAHALKPWERAWRAPRATLQSRSPRVRTVEVLLSGCRAPRSGRRPCPQLSHPRETAREGVQTRGKAFKVHPTKVPSPRSGSNSPAATRQHFRGARGCGGLVWRDPARPAVGLRPNEAAARRRRYQPT